MGWWSDELVRINIRTNEITTYPAPHRDCGPYHAVTDPEGQIWVVCQTADQLLRFNPQTKGWTQYDIPLLGLDAHGMGVGPKLINGRVRVAVPSWTTSKTILMDVRKQEDIQALKAEAR